MVHEEEGVLSFEQERRRLEAWLQYYYFGSVYQRPAYKDCEKPLRE